MVTIVDFATRTRSDGTTFFALILSGGIDFVKSRKTERYYVTQKKASISSTLDETTCKASIGQQFPGTIQKQSCEPYSFVVKETGEVLQLDYRWVYVPQGASLEEAVFEGIPEKAESQKKPENALFLRTNAF